LEQLFGFAVIAWMIGPISIVFLQVEGFLHGLEFRKMARDSLFVSSLLTAVPKAWR
jgi:hypothetical protein